MNITCPKCGREYPEERELCPTEACKQRDIKTLIFPPEGGILMYIWGYKYPMLCFPTKDTLDACANTKRALVAQIKFIVKQPLFWPSLVIGRARLLSNIQNFMEDVYNANFYHKFQPMLDRNLICKSAREIRRVLTRMFGEHRWIDCIVGWYEMDTAYRYRIQDIFGMFDEDKLFENTRKEVLTVFDIYESRERNEGVAEKMKLLRKILSLVLFISPKLRYEIRRFFSEADASELMLTLNDNYWVGRIEEIHYDFNGKTWAEQNKYSHSLEEGWKEEERPVKK